MSIIPPDTIRATSDTNVSKGDIMSEDRTVFTTVFTQRVRHVLWANNREIIELYFDSTLLQGACCKTNISPSKTRICRR